MRIGKKKVRVDGQEGQEVGLLLGWFFWKFGKEQEELRNVGKGDGEERRFKKALLSLWAALGYLSIKSLSYFQIKVYLLGGFIDNNTFWAWTLWVSFQRSMVRRFGFEASLYYLSADWLRANNLSSQVAFLIPETAVTVSAPPHRLWGWKFQILEFFVNFKK